MDVVDVAPEIGVIADRMFPVPTLPNPFFSFDDLAGAAFDDTCPELICTLDAADRYAAPEGRSIDRRA